MMLWSEAIPFSTLSSRNEEEPAGCYAIVTAGTVIFRTDGKFRATAETIDKEQKLASSEGPEVEG